MKDKKYLRIYVIYEKPTDFPNHFVCRGQYTDLETQQISTDNCALVSENADYLRKELVGMGLTKIERHPNDDPVIMETWI